MNTYCEFLTLDRWVWVPSCPELHCKERWPAHSINQNYNQGHLYCFGHRSGYTRWWWSHWGRKGIRWVAGDPHRRFKVWVKGFRVIQRSLITVAGCIGMLPCAQKWCRVALVCVRLSVRQDIRRLVGVLLFTWTVTAIWLQCMMGVVIIAVRLRRVTNTPSMKFSTWVSQVASSSLFCFSGFIVVLSQAGHAEQDGVFLHVGRQDPLRFQIDVIIDLLKYSHLKKETVTAKMSFIL